MTHEHRGRRAPYQESLNRGNAPFACFIIIIIIISGWDLLTMSVCWGMGVLFCKGRLWGQAEQPGQTQMNDIGIGLRKSPQFSPHQTMVEGK